ncbi:hypothetical protein Ga0100231_016520 [Opitutaceae bacterium TAV4]|nr:hypothetical protein Ga0100231_016520 [Opitutaceae bacterium TAV4]RRK02175.1 hypothetical protein Ga0100230_002975 [Opitutaceae bacterium TAV3]
MKHPTRALSVCLALQLSPLHPLQAQAAPPSPEGTPLWREYIQAPDTHPNLPNVSYSGYHYGEQPIPDIAGPVFNVRERGAKGDGQTDDTAAVRATLEAVNETGGVVYFPKGRYRLNDILFVHTNNTVLRGENRDATELLFTRSLTDAHGRNEMPPDARGIHRSRWSWQGGLVWFTPRSTNTWRDGNTPLSRGPSESWQLGETAGSIAAPARRGDRSITLDRNPAGKIRPGDFVAIVVEQPKDLSLLRHLAGDGAWAEAYNWKQNNSSGYPGRLPQALRWVVEVSAINDRTLTLRQPLRFDLRPQWTSRVHRLGATIRESGIENLTVRLLRDYTWEQSRHNQEPGWNGPWFNQAIHCWLRAVTVIDADNGPGVAASKCVTLTDFIIEASRPETQLQHHGASCRVASADCLFSDFEIRARPLHGINVEQFSSGNVWTRGRMAHGTFDTHRNMPFENVRTDITVNNDGRHGGTGGPPMAARFVHWNIRVTNAEPYIIGWANLMPSGAIVGLQGTKPVQDVRPKETPTGPLSATRIESPDTIPNPANLYEAQLRLRLAVVRATATQTSPAVTKP